MHSTSELLRTLLPLDVLDFIDRSAHKWSEQPNERIEIKNTLTEERT